ncbi:hypothetical protein CULT_310043 [[Clostridium] ultunense Esp]|nr:hypothetical protein CULT_310043 [[Clostridium] ultunense Esp]
MKKLGASGVLKPTANNVQVIIGTRAEIIADEIKNNLDLLNKK